MDAGPLRVAFVCWYHEALRSAVLPLCGAMRRSTEWAPHVILDGDAEGRMQAMCREASVPHLTVGRRKRGSKPPSPGATRASPRTTREPAPAPETRRLGLLRAFSRTTGALLSTRAKIWRLGNILNRIQPAVVATLDDRTLLACRWIGAAQHRGIPVVTIQWAATHRADALLDVRSAQKPSERHTPAARMLDGLIARCVPHAARERGGQTIWWMPPPNSLGLWAANAYPKLNPWTFGGGNSESVAVLGEAWKARLVHSGVTPQKIVVTGSPEHDKWYRMASAWNRQETEAVHQELGIPADRRIVTVIAPALCFRKPGACRSGDSSVEEIRNDLRFVVQLIREAGTSFAPVIKVHPRDREADFAFFRDEATAPLWITRDYPVDRLIAASCAMTCQWSSTVMLANALRTPVLVFDFHGSPGGDVWRDAIGVRFAASHPEFAEKMTACLNDPAARAEMLHDRDAFVSQYLRLDGGATERLLDLLRSHARRATSGAAMS